MMRYKKSILISGYGYDSGLLGLGLGSEFRVRVSARSDNQDPRRDVLRCVGLYCLEIVL
jgi:hypothetical protein